jgi:hypothetical protein
MLLPLDPRQMISGMTTGVGFHEACLRIILAGSKRESRLAPSLFLRGVLSRSNLLFSYLSWTPSSNLGRSRVLLVTKKPMTEEPIFSSAYTLQHSLGLFIDYISLIFFFLCLDTKKQKSGLSKNVAKNHKLRVKNLIQPQPANFFSRLRF